VEGTFGELEEGKSVLAIGPGLGTHRQTQEFIRTIVTQTELPVVLDADGLNAFDGHTPSLRKRKTKFLPSLRILAKWLVCSVFPQRTCKPAA